MPRNIPSIVGKTVFGNLVVSLDTHEVQGLMNDPLGVGNAKSIEAFMSNASSLVTERIAKLARERLSVGNSRNVGTTGEASKAIHVKPQGKTDSVIFETAIQNMFIREGRGTGGKQPSIPEIKTWLVTKPGIQFKNPDEKPWRMTKKGGPRANLSSRPPRPFKKDLRSVAYLIARKIKAQGLTHFKKLYPGSSAKYDYYAEILNRSPGRAHFEKLVTKEYANWFTLYVNYIRRGRVVAARQKEIF